MAINIILQKPNTKVSRFSSLQASRGAYARIASQSKAEAKSLNKQHRAQKPLLHHVLRTAALKAQQHPKLRLRELKNLNISEEADVVMEDKDDDMLI